MRVQADANGAMLAELMSPAEYEAVLQGGGRVMAFIPHTEATLPRC